MREPSPLSPLFLHFDGSYLTRFPFNAILRKYYNFVVLKIISDLIPSGSAGPQNWLGKGYPIMIYKNGHLTHIQVTSGLISLIDFAEVKY
jgi:hypothetical protein